MYLSVKLLANLSPFLDLKKSIDQAKTLVNLPDADQKNAELVAAMRHYDKTVHITWVMGHLNTAKKYIESGQGSGEATGGSDWKKYMLPKYQKRIFFPELWSAEEIENWGA